MATPPRKSLPPLALCSLALLPSMFASAGGCVPSLQSRGPDCSQAARLQSAAAQLYAQRRLAAAARLFDRAAAGCRRDAPSTWSAYLDVLGKLGRDSDARSLAHRVLHAPSAPNAAILAARAALAPSRVDIEALLGIALSQLESDPVAAQEAFEQAAARRGVDVVTAPEGQPWNTSRAPSWSQDGNVMALAWDDRTEVLRLVDGRLLWTFPPSHGPAYLSNDGTRVAICWGDSVELRSVTTGERIGNPVRVSGIRRHDLPMPWTVDRDASAVILGGTGGLELRRFEDGKGYRLEPQLPPEPQSHRLCGECTDWHDPISLAFAANGRLVTHWYAGFREWNLANMQLVASYDLPRKVWRDERGSVVGFTTQADPQRDCLQSYDEGTRRTTRPFCDPRCAQPGSWLPPEADVPFTLGPNRVCIWDLAAQRVRHVVALPVDPPGADSRCDGDKLHTSVLDVSWTQRRQGWLLATQNDCEGERFRVERHLHLYDAKRGSVTDDLGFAVPLGKARDGSLVALRPEPRQVLRVLGPESVETTSLPSTLALPDAPDAFAMDPDAGRLLVKSAHAWEAWDLHTGRHLLTRPSHAPQPVPIDRLGFVAGELAVVTAHGRVALWDFTTRRLQTAAVSGGEQLHAQNELASDVSAGSGPMVLSLDRYHSRMVPYAPGWLVSVYAPTLSIQFPLTGQIAAIPQASIDGKLCMASDGASTQVVICQNEALLSVDSVTGAAIARTPLPCAPELVALERRTLVVACRQGQTRPIHLLRDGAIQGSLGTPGSSVAALALSSDSAKIAWIDASRNLHVAPTDTFQDTVVRRSARPSRASLAVAFSDDGSLLAHADEEEIEIIDARTSNTLSSMRVPGEEICAVAVHGDRIAVGTKQGTVRVLRREDRTAGAALVVLRFAGDAVVAEIAGRYRLGGERRDAERMLECRIDDRLFPFRMCEDRVAVEDALPAPSRARPVGHERTSP